jgi:ribokinase
MGIFTLRCKCFYYYAHVVVLLHLRIVAASASTILVCGSANADTFLPVKRLPAEGENILLLHSRQPIVDVPGGKGCTQAVAAAKLLSNVNEVGFLGQFGTDAAATVLQTALDDAGVNVDSSGQHAHLPSGRGYVFITENGQVSAVVSGGSNRDGWSEWEQAWNDYPNNLNNELVVKLDSLLDGCKCLLLQREVPEYVNQLMASIAHGKGVVVIQDIGGEDRPIDSKTLECCNYIAPNESELHRLVATFNSDIDELDKEDDSMIVSLAKILQKRGACNVLVTRGSRGSTLVCADGNVLHQPAYKVSKVIDETGAGDCFRAAFAVALMEGKTLTQCMKFASAAGACSVEKHGAVPSTPTREELENRLSLIDTAEKSVLPGNVLNAPPRGGGDDFPFLIGSRLNSMKDRPELWDSPLKDPKDYVRRQSTIKGLTCVDFNYPQHFSMWSASEAKIALDAAGLKAGAVCLRYPPKFARGAMNHPDPRMRREAIQLTKEAAKVAKILGCNEVVIWSAYDGYDYYFQVDYDEKWNELVAAFRECCDEFPDIKVRSQYGLTNFQESKSDSDILLPGSFLWNTNRPTRTHAFLRFQAQGLLWYLSPKSIGQTSD